MVETPTWSRTPTPYPTASTPLLDLPAGGWAAYLSLPAGPLDGPAGPGLGEFGTVLACIRAQFYLQVEAEFGIFL